MKSAVHVPITAALAALLFLLLAVLALPTHAAVYTTSLTATQPPGVYPGTPATGGLFFACENTNNPNASTTNRVVLNVIGTEMAGSMPSAIPTGTYYLGGYFDETLNGWFWSADSSNNITIKFGAGAASGKINDVLAMNWAANYPVTVSATSVGSLKYVAYDANLKGWINVDGTQPLSGVACQSSDIIADEKKKGFPWWGILIIVLGCVAIIAVIVVVVVCCCCKKNKKRNFDDADDESSFSSRSSSFTSRGTSYTGSTSSDSFSSRGSSYSGSSKGSAYTGSTSSGSFTSRSSGSSSSFSGSSSRASESSGSYASGASSVSSSSRGSSSRTSSSRGSSFSGSSSSRGSSSRGSFSTGSRSH